MNLATKLVHPNHHSVVFDGLTYKEWLVGMLAANSMLFTNVTKGTEDYYPHLGKHNAKIVIKQADAIIKELEK